MNNRLFAAVAILVLGFLLVAFSIVQSSNNSILDRVAMQQDTIMKNLQIIDMRSQGVRPSVQIISPPAQQAPAPMMAMPSTGADTAALQNKIQALEQRLASLEGDAKPIIDQVKAQREAYEKQRKEMEEAMKKVYDIEIGASPVRGNRSAANILVEFTDFQCPYCSRFRNVPEETLKAFPDKVKFVLKNYPLPFHQEAKPAAKAVLAAKEQGKYWEMVDAILKDNSSLSAAKYSELAKSIGLNVDKFNKDLKDKDAQFEKYIQSDIDLANKVNVRGTPAFYFNGKMMPQPDVNYIKNILENGETK